VKSVIISAALSNHGHKYLDDDVSVILWEFSDDVLTVLE